MIQQVHVHRVGSLQIKRSSLVTFLNAQMFVPVSIKTCTYYGHNHRIMLKIWEETH